MKKSEFKKIIKPIVAECIKESLLEGGLLSGIISEVVKGVAPVPPPPEPARADPLTERMQKNAFSVQETGKLREHKKKLMSAIGSSAYNGVDLFEGTTPAPPQRNPHTAPGPLAGQDPGNPGVDISTLMGSVGNHWNAHMSDVKEGK